MSDYHRRLPAGRCPRHWCGKHKPDWPSWLFISDNPRAKPDCKCGAEWDSSTESWYVVRDYYPGELELIRADRERILSKLRRQT